MTGWDYPLSWLKDGYFSFVFLFYSIPKFINIAIKDQEYFVAYAKACCAFFSVSFVKCFKDPIIGPWLDCKLMNYENNFKTISFSLL